MYFINKFLSNFVFFFIDNTTFVLAVINIRKHVPVMVIEGPLQLFKELRRFTCEKPEVVSRF